MKNIIKIVTIIACILVFFAFTVFEIGWNIDPDCSIKFSGNKAEGTFSGLLGKIVFNPSDISTSLIDISVNANTIKTGNSIKDKHAKGEDWLDVIKYPYIKFKSSSFTKSANYIIVLGTLELHGIKKQVQIPFTFSESGNKGSFIGSFKVMRNDYGIKGNFFGFTVGNEFNISLNIPVTK